MEEIIFNGQNTRCWWYVFALFDNSMLFTLVLMISRQVDFVSKQCGCGGGGGGCGGGGCWRGPRYKYTSSQTKCN